MAKRLAALLTALIFIVAEPALSDVADIDDGVPETLDDQIRKSVTPPEDTDQNGNQSQQGQGPYIYNGYPYPFIYPYVPPVGNVNPYEQPSMLRRR